MIDSQLIESLAYLDSIDRLVDSKSKEYLDSSKLDSMLTVNYQDINNLLAQQAVQASQAMFYNTISARMNSICYMWDETVFYPYLAHCREYASIYLNAIDKKDTKEAINDTVMLLFSKKADKVIYATTCFDFKLKKSEDELELYRKTAEYTEKLIDYAKIMYPFSESYEDMISKRNTNMHRKQLAENLAEAHKNLMIASSNIVKLKLVGSSYVPKGNITEDQILARGYHNG